MDEKQIEEILSYQFNYGCDKIYCQNIYCRNSEKFKYKNKNTEQLKEIINQLSKSEDSQKYICKYLPPMIKNTDLLSNLKNLKEWTYKFILSVDEEIGNETENYNEKDESFKKRTKKIEEAIYKINDISDYLPYFLLSNEKPLSPSNPSIDERLLYQFTSKASSIRELSAALLSLVNSNVDFIKQTNLEYYSSIRCFFIIFSFPQIIDYRHQEEVLNPMISYLRKLPKIALRWLTILPKTISAAVGCCQFGISNFFSNHLNTSPHVSFITDICKSLSVLYDANINAFVKIPISQFYNYHINERISPEDELSLNRDFSFLRFPFVLSLRTKYKLCKIQSDQIMSSLAVSSFVFSVPQRLMSSSNKMDPFLSIHIRRDYLLEDAESQLKSKGQNSLSFLKKLKVVFEGENAVDIGGPSREFLYLSTEKLFDPLFGLFTIVNNKYHWFNKNDTEGIYSYETVGIIVGLAVYNSYLLPIQFPTVLYKKLLFSDRELNLADLEEIDPQAADSLKKIKVMKNNREDVLSLDLTFDKIEEINGQTVSIPLKEGMGGVQVNSDNVDEYVQSYIDYELKTSIKKKFEDFQRGFLMPCRAPLYQLLDPVELSVLVSGETAFDWASLKKNAEYQDGYDYQSNALKWFWEIFDKMTNDEKKLFLKFVTGTDKAPLGGLGNVKLIIQKSDEIEKLPMAHTCFNIFCLPDYKSKEIMEKKINIAIQYTEGFGII